jgi:hypothetical protein
MFEKLIHADWSTHQNKKWMTTAERTAQGWHVGAPRPVPCANELMKHRLFSGKTVLAGFDFPIGVPAIFGKKTGFGTFPEALAEFGIGGWSEFFNVAEKPEQISVRRPFYPRTYMASPKQAHLLQALEVTSIDELRRTCERKRSDRRAACPLFWTLGGNQVGKAAIDGWKYIIKPALLGGARLWPFDGPLDQLSKSSRCVLCETYPQEAYGHVCVKFRTGESKRVQKDRQRGGAAMLRWAGERSISLSEDARTQICDGFGPSDSGEDPFDACVGLLSMIDVVDGRRPAGSPSHADEIAWEGWILGQQGGE